MSARNEDFLFAQEAMQLGFVTEAQVKEGLLLQRRMSEELSLEERLAVILVKRGWMGEEQARRVGSRIDPSGAREEIAGYRLVEIIGRGAMGTVYKAVHLGLHRVVAIKVLRKDLAQDPTQVERLKSEAKLLASLDHPHIVRALDAGESNGFPFVVMEYIEGESLRDRIAREGPLSEEDALRIARGLADALERARRMGVVHRDVKPGNVLLTREGQPKLMDLGLAKGPIDLGLTQHGATVGTPQYISPEQAQDPKKADTRSDIYSLGGTLYAMLTGRPPFEGSTLAEILKKVLYETPMPPRVLNREVSPEVAYLIERMMLKDPSLRYRTPAEVVRAIDRILGGASIVPRGFTGSWEGYLLRLRARRAAKVGGLTIAFGVVVGIAIALFVQRSRTITALERGERIVADALVGTDVRSADDEPTLRTKLERTRDALRRLGTLDIEKREALRARERELKQATEDLSKWNAAVRPSLEEHLRAGRFDRAKAEAEMFQKRVPGVDSPADVEAQKSLGRIVSESETALVTVRRSLRENVATWAELVAAHREHEARLQAGFVATQAFERAREDAKAATKVLEDLTEAVDLLAEEFAATRIARSAETFDLEALRRKLVQQREALLAQAARQWESLKLEGPHASIVVGLLRGRLEEIEADVERTVAAAWGEAERALEREARSRDLEVAQGVPERVRKIAKALEKGEFQRLALQAWETKDRIERDLHSLQVDADANYEEVVVDLIEYLQEGRTPEDLRLRIQKAENRADEWPDRYQDEIRALYDVPEGLRRLYGYALDGLQERRSVKNVRMRAGPPEKRWDVQDVHHGEHAVTVVVTREGRPTPPQKRLLGELAMGQVMELAQIALSELPPLELAVALLGERHERVGIDLRPVIKVHRLVLDAWRDVGRNSRLHRWLEAGFAVVAREQARREDSAFRLLSDADTYFKLKKYEDAYASLVPLLREDSPAHWTDFFDKNEARIHELAALVTAHLFNVKLQEHFPGAAISGQPANPAQPANPGQPAKSGQEDVTTLLFDFETPAQLQLFRKEPGRGWGVLEQYGLTAPTTPEQGTSARLHLLRGLEDEFTRDRPLSLPSPFDPARSIVVQFDLFTLKSPSFFAIDIDGLQVGILSLDPTSTAYAKRFGFPEDAPPLERGEKPPTVDFYGRGRGVAFHAGPDFGDPSTWEWKPDTHGRHHEAWTELRNKKPPQALPPHLFAFEAGQRYRVKVVRELGRLTLHVNDVKILSGEKPGADWHTKGKTSDRDRSIRGGTGRIQILTWTPQAIDNLAVSGVILERYR